jgi:hypothetical protein
MRRERPEPTPEEIDRALAKVSAKRIGADGRIVPVNPAPDRPAGPAGKVEPLPDRSQPEQ